MAGRDTGSSHSSSRPFAARSSPSRPDVPAGAAKGSVAAGPEAKEGSERRRPLAGCVRSSEECVENKAEISGLAQKFPRRAKADATD
jgi:hypothetical protein